MFEQIDFIQNILLLNRFSQPAICFNRLNMIIGLENKTNSFYLCKREVGGFFKTSYFQDLEVSFLII